MSAQIKGLVEGVAVAVLGATAFARAPTYETRRIPMGPRPDQYVLFPVNAQRGGDRPYALTGYGEVKTVRRVVQRWSGPRFIGPVWVTERVVE